jgi:hypothetical protein
MGQKRDLTGIEVRKFKKGEKFRAYAADPSRPGRKIGSPWGTYEEAQEWRRRVLALKLDVKQRKQRRRAEEKLMGAESTLLKLVQQPGVWTVRLQSGETLQVAAHSYEDDHNGYRFLMLMQGKPPFETEVLRVPRRAVAEIRGG